MIKCIWLYRNLLKLFFILVITCIIAVLLVIPYSLDITSSSVKITPIILLLTAVQNLVLFAVAVFFGLFLSRRIGMGLPIIQGILEGKNQSKEIKSILTPSVGLGVLAGVLIVLLSIPFNRLIPEFRNPEVLVPAWKAFLVSFYGGIAEEVLLRLFLVSLFVWITFKIKKSVDGQPTSIGIWLSIVLAAIFFGLGHFYYGKRFRR
jgi:membrane protease YdiL (CAAX protease family)